MERIKSLGFSFLILKLLFVHSFYPCHHYHYSYYHEHCLVYAVFSLGAGDAL